MDFTKTVIAVNLEDESIKTLSQLKDMPLPESCNIYLVHVFELHSLSIELMPNLRPGPEDLLAIQKWGEDKLFKVKELIGLSQYKNCHVKCLISSNPRQEFLSYADSLGATLIVSATKERAGVKGLFESSFTNFLHKFSKANLLLLRPERS